MSITPSPQTVSGQSRNETGKFLTGSTMGHVINMTSAASVGLVAIFLVDALNLFYISQLGQKELAAAVGYSGTLLFFATSVGIGLSIASTAMTARALGRGEREEAKKIAGAAMVIMTSALLIISLLLWPFLEPLLRLLGAEGETLVLALRFSRMVLPSLFLMGMGMGSSALLRALGDGKRAMYVTLGTAIATALLDPLLIFGLPIMNRMLP